MNQTFCHVLLIRLIISLVNGVVAGASEVQEFGVLSFNILQGGRNAANVGFPDHDFGGSRIDEIAEVILVSGAQIVGIQEDDRSSKLLDALGPGWGRAGSVYARYPLEMIQESRWMTVVKASIFSEKPIYVVNCHWRPSNYGPGQVRDLLVEQGPPKDMTRFAKKILISSDKSTGNRSYAETMQVLQPLLEKSIPIVVTGDFNEPSHLDWTARYAELGADRWVQNKTKTPLRFKIAWKGSQILANAGLIDVYRNFFKDEVLHPGNTWTPEYPEKTPGRVAYADQVNDRIDMIYFTGLPLRIKAVAVLGEAAESADIVYRRRWPSDHRAVLATFSITP